MLFRSIASYLSLERLFERDIARDIRSTKIRRPTGLAVVRSGPAPRSGASSFAKRSFKQQAKLVVGEALASPPQPQEWPLKPWTPRFLHPAEAPAAIFKKNAPKPRWVYILSGGKKWQEKFPRPLLEVTKVFFCAPEALQERSGSDFVGPGVCVRVLLGFMSFLERFGAFKMPPGRSPEP